MMHVEKKGTMKTKTEYVRKAYTQIISLDSTTEAKITELSQVLLALWNIGVHLGLQWLKVEPVEPSFIPDVLVKNQSPTAFSYNYWLASARQRDWKLKLKDREVGLASISSDASREVLRKLAGSFQSYFELRKKKDPRARMPQIKLSEWFQTISWTVGTLDEEKETPRAVIVPGMNKERISLSLGEYLREKLKGKRMVHITLSRTRDGEYKLSVVCASDLPEPNEKGTLVRAIDLGSGDVAVSDSSGAEYLIPTRRPDKYWRRHVKQVEKRVEACVKGSRAYKRRMSARRTMFEKMEHQHRDHQRKLADALASAEVRLIVVGKMKTRLGLARSERGTDDQHWGVQNTGYASRLRIFLKEKALERDIKMVELADPKREGALTEPEAKFNASRTLLKTQLETLALPLPTEFVRRKFIFAH